MVLTDGIDVEVIHGGHMDPTNRYIGGSSRIFQFSRRWFDHSAIRYVARNILQYESLDRVWYSKPGMPDVLHDIRYDENVPGELLAAAELGRVVIYLEATMATEVGWDNEDGNVGDREGLDSDFFESDWDASRYDGNNVRRERRRRSQGFSEEVEQRAEASGSNQPYIEASGSNQPYIEVEDSVQVHSPPVQVDLSLEEGMIFTDASEMKEAVVNYSIAVHADIRWKHSGENKMIATCKQSQCGWRVYGALVKDSHSFVIKKLDGPHSCEPVKKNKQVTSKWIANYFLERFRVNPDWDVQEIAAKLKEKFDVEVEQRTCYRARDKAKKLIRRGS